MHIYKITNLINKKIYIGLSVSSTDERWKSHLWNARENSNSAIDRAIHRYGKKNFKYEIIERVPFSKGIRHLENREIFYISKFKSNKGNVGYNRSLGGNVNVAKRISEIHKAKASKSQPSLIKIAAYKKNGDLFRKFNSLKEASTFFNCTSAAIHKSLNRQDRLCQNFMWRTSKSDKFHKKINKFTHTILRKRKEVYQWSKEGEFIKKYNSISEASKETKITPGDISRVLKGITMFSKGSHWTYKKKFIEPRKKKIIGGNTEKNYIYVNVYTDKGKYIETCKGVAFTGRKYKCDPSEISKCILEKKRAHRFQNGKTYQFKKYDGSKRNIKPLIKPLHGKKEILMYSLDGKFLKQFNSTIEASRKMHIPRKTINHSLTGSTITGKNYLWKYKLGKIQRKIPAYKIKDVKVLKYDFDGNFIKEFQTIKAAADSVKTNPANIQRCIDKKGYSSHQHYWFRKKNKMIKKKIQVPIFI